MYISRYSAVTLFYTDFFSYVVLRPESPYIKRHAPACRRRRSPVKALPGGTGTSTMEPAGMAVPGTTCMWEASNANRLTLLRAAIASRVSPGFVVMATVVGGPDGMSTSGLAVIVTQTE